MLVFISLYHIPLTNIQKYAHLKTEHSDTKTHKDKMYEPMSDNTDTLISRNSGDLNYSDISSCYSLIFWSNPVFQQFLHVFLFVTFNVTFITVTFKLFKRHARGKKKTRYIDLFSKVLQKVAFNDLSIYKI